MCFGGARYFCARGIRITALSRMISHPITVRVGLGMSSSPIFIGGGFGTGALYLANILGKSLFVSFSDS